MTTYERDFTISLWRQLTLARNNILEEIFIGLFQQFNLVLTYRNRFYQISNVDCSYLEIVILCLDKMDVIRRLHELGRLADLDWRVL